MRGGRVGFLRAGPSRSVPVRTSCPPLAPTRRTHSWPRGSALRRLARGTSWTSGSSRCPRRLRALATNCVRFAFAPSLWSATPRPRGNQRCLQREHPPAVPVLIGLLSFARLRVQLPSLAAYQQEDVAALLGPADVLLNTGLSAVRRFGPSGFASTPLSPRPDLHVHRGQPRSARGPAEGATAQLRHEATAHDLPFNLVIVQGSTARRTDGVRSPAPVFGSALGNRPDFKADEAPTKQLLALGSHRVFAHIRVRTHYVVARTTCSHAR